VENLKLLGARASKSLPAELLERAAGVALLDELED
jgi:DNA recombination protein RmuC